MFIHLFCGEEKIISATEILAFVEEGVYFDNDPLLQIKSQDDKGWAIIEIQYDAKRHPIIMHCETDQKEINEYLEEAINEIQVAGFVDSHQDLVQFLKYTKQIYFLKWMRYGLLMIVGKCWII